MVEHATTFNEVVIDFISRAEHMARTLAEAR
jgi:hypothetical protein